MTVHTGNESAPTPDEAVDPPPETTGPDIAAAEPQSTAEKVSGKKAGDKKAAGKKAAEKKTDGKKAAKKPSDAAPEPTTAREAEPAPQDASAQPSRLRRFGRALRRPRTLVPLVVIVVLLGVLGWGVTMLRDKNQTENARTSALDAGRRYATDLATYSYQNLDNNMSMVRAHSAGEFSGQYQQVASNLKDLILKYQSNSSAKIIQAGLVNGNRDTAEVIVFLDQTVTNTNSPQPRVDRNRMQLSLIRQDGEWKLSNVQLM